MISNAPSGAGRGRLGWAKRLRSPPPFPLFNPWRGEEQPPHDPAASPRRVHHPSAHRPTSVHGVSQAHPRPAPAHVPDPLPAAASLRPSTNSLGTSLHPDFGGHKRILHRRSSLGGLGPASPSSARNQGSPGISSVTAHPSPRSPSVPSTSPPPCPTPSLPTPPPRRRPRPPPPPPTCAQGTVVRAPLSVTNVVLVPSSPSARFPAAARLRPPKKPSSTSTTTTTHLRMMTTHLRPHRPSRARLLLRLTLSDCRWRRAGSPPQ